MNKGLIRLSPAVRYTLQGLVHLVGRPESAFCLVSHSARHHQLPKDFLAKLFQRLVLHGILRSKRGPGGGYALAKNPTTIYLSEILDCIEGPWDQGPYACAMAEKLCDTQKPCLLHDSVMQANRLLKDTLAHYTLADFAKEGSHALE